MQVTLTTTVKAVLQQVQETVERCMCASVCAGYTHGHHHEISGGDSAPCSLVRPTSLLGRSGGKDYSSGSVVDGAHAADPSTSRTPHLTDCVHEAELCLCLQDKDGEYRWVGGTQHFHKVAVLRAPFITEVCLRTHAVFEEERRQWRRKARQERTSVRSSSSSSLSLTLASHASSMFPSLYRSAEDARNVSDSRERSDERSDQSAKSTHETRGGASVNAPATSAATAAANKGHAAHTLTDQSFARKASRLKFAFLKGVVVPIVVLRQCNPQYAMGGKHHPYGRTPRQYAEVRVPADMQAEPLDDSLRSSGTVAASGTAQVKSKESVAHAEVLPPRVAPVSTSDRLSDTALRSPASPHSTSTPATRDTSAETPCLAAALMSTSSSSPSASSASTLPSRSASLDQSCGAVEDAHGPRSHPSVFDTHQVHSYHSTAAAAARTATAAGPVGLVAHATTVERTSEASDPRATAATLRVRGTVKAQAGELVAREEAAVRSALAAAQQDYTAALAEYKAVVACSSAKSTAVGECEVQPLQPAACADAELVALLQRRIELQRQLQVCREAEQQCERLTMLAERLEKEVREQEERRVPRMPLRHGDDSAAFVAGY
ncbi:hypothetical protein LMJF_17_1170 [Leishmania major strain Friedlin]|uniref:Uncharacterized protein n=1 Tax=Leishmania major TaxID=5664 RepID=Q4QE74_LEIMA|nr:hypothetical protein LMJF_17_1170 [Leishmania major strain Friedlin]CAG9572350.1 hypothetical_protein_-_conserved [Leishmania major strain Friedlin]CAJ03885.1 hypothetical protein LMJF_17_1170 [Leishmania major strain Friedlin]|eukprot:XP_001682374.1 hypothetical protein LMJF_17_1170 [Leishmania major strain Friedlin]